MKILFVANRTPYPPYRGDKLKIYNLAKLLAHNHELHLITFAEDKNDFAYLPELEKIFSKIKLIHLPKWKSVLNCLTAIYDNSPLQVLYFKDNKMQQEIDNWMANEQYNVIHIQHIRMAQFMLKHTNRPRILDLPDAFSLYWKRRQKTTKSYFKRLFEQNEQKRLFQSEQSVIPKFEMSLACSQEDIDYLQKQHGINNLKLLPNGVDTQTFVAGKHDYTHNHTLLFTGNMDYAPNVDAVIYFANDILPIIQAAHPEIKFIIAGQKPVEKVLALASKHVIVTGFVEDMAAAYNQASVVVAPLRFGAGTQNKVLEAMAMGVPVVCTEIGFQGLGIENGEGAFKETSPETFAAGCIALLNSSALREKTGHAGIEIISNKFSWDKIALQLEQYLFDVQQMKKAEA